MNIRGWFGGGNAQANDFSPLSDQHRKRQKLFALYWKYYRGEHKRQIVTTANKPDDNVVLNYSQEIVDQGIDFLFGEELTFELDSTSLDRTPDEQYLDSVWGDAETKMMFLQKLAQNGGVTGTAFVRLYDADPNVPGSLPRLVNLEPGSVDIITADDDAEQVVAYHVVWPSGMAWKRHRIDWLVEDGVWIITPEVAENNRRWVADGDVEVWPYEFAPVFHCQNLPLANTVWGISDLENADLNDAINRTAGNTGRIIRFHAHPKTVGTGFNAQQLDTTNVNDFWTIEKTDAKVFTLEMQSDLASSRAYAQDLKTAFHKVTGASEFDPALVNVGALSGFALKILYMPTLKRTQRKRNTYGAMLKRICEALFVLRGQVTMATMNGTQAQAIDVHLVWQSPLPESGMEQAQQLAIDVQNGLSQSTYLERRGYDPVIEQEKRKAESAEAIAQQQAMLQQRSPLRQAMADLGEDDTDNEEDGA